MAAEPAQIHQADAWELLQQGGCILMSGAPAETIIGLDLAAWAVNTTFCGFKMVPPGPHFLSISSSKSMAPKTGWFVNIARADVVVYLWSDAEERFLHSGEPGFDLSQAKILKGQCRTMALDKALAPYPMQQLMQWASLCHSISSEVLDSVLPVSRRVDALADISPGLAQPSDTNPKPGMHSSSDTARYESPVSAAGSAADTAMPDAAEPVPDAAAVRRLQHAADLHDAQVPRGSRFFFTPLPGAAYDSSPKWRTAYGVDPSGCLVAACLEAGGASALIAQLQIAFVAFSLGESLQAYQAWKYLFSAFCCAEWLLTDAYGEGCATTPVPAALSGLSTPLHCSTTDFNQQDLAKVFDIMEAQVKMLPDEFSREDVTSCSFVERASKKLRGTLARHGNTKDLKLAPYQTCSGFISQPLERSIERFLQAASKSLRISGMIHVQPPCVEPQSDLASARLSADEVRALLADNWDGDDDDDLPVVVDAMAGVSIS